MTTAQAVYKESKDQGNWWLQPSPFPSCRVTSKQSEGGKEIQLVVLPLFLWRLLRGLASLQAESHSGFLPNQPPTTSAIPAALLATIYPRALWSLPTAACGLPKVSQCLLPEQAESPESPQLQFPGSNSDQLQQKSG